MPEQGEHISCSNFNSSDDYQLQTFTTAQCCEIPISITFLSIVFLPWFIYRISTLVLIQGS
jgi:hypothetical protein